MSARRDTVPPGPATPAEELTVGRLGQALRRHLARILVTAALLVLVTAIVLFFIEPRYTSRSALYVGSDIAAITGVTTSANARLPDEPTIESEIEVIKSRQIINAVIDRLGLAERPEFAEAGLLRALFGARPSRRVAGEGYGPEREIVIDNFLDHLEVYQQGRSRVIVIEFWSHDPALAARVVNALAHEYIQTNLRSKVATTEQVIRWLQGQVKRLRRQVLQAEQDIDRYKAAHPLLVAERNAQALKRLDELDGLLTRARSQRIAAEARLAELRRLAGHPDASRLVLAATDDATRAPLEMAQLKADAALRSAGVQYGPLHPRRLAAAAERRTVAGGLDRNRRVALQREDLALEAIDRQARQYQGEIERLTAALAEARTRRIRLNAMERDAQSNRQLLDSLLTRLKDLRARREILDLTENKRVISRGFVPAEPSFPRKGPILAIALVAGLLLGGFLALAHDGRPPAAD